jgi:hypothetical protein
MGTDQDMIRTFVICIYEISSNELHFLNEIRSELVN